MTQDDRFPLLARLAAAVRRGGDGEVRAAAAALAAAEGAEAVRALLRFLEPFVGFPLVLEALAAAAPVLEPPPPDGAPPLDPAAGERAFRAVWGPDADAVLQRLGALDPTFRDWVLEHAYGRAYAESGLDLASGERLAVLLLADLGAFAPCAGHLRACRRLGVADAVLRRAAAAWPLPPERRRRLEELLAAGEETR